MWNQFRTIMTIKSFPLTRHCGREQVLDVPVNLWRTYFTTKHQTHLKKKNRKTHFSASTTKYALSCLGRKGNSNVQKPLQSNTSQSQRVISNEFVGSICSTRQLNKNPSISTFKQSMVNHRISCRNQQKCNPTQNVGSANNQWLVFGDVQGTLSMPYNLLQANTCRENISHCVVQTPIHWGYLRPVEAAKQPARSGGDGSGTQNQHYLTKGEREHTTTKGVPARAKYAHCNFSAYNHNPSKE